MMLYLKVHPKDANLEVSKEDDIQENSYIGFNRSCLSCKRN